MDGSPMHPGGTRVVQYSSTMLLIESQRDTTRARCGFGGAFKPDYGRKDIPLLPVQRLVRFLCPVVRPHMEAPTKKIVLMAIVF